MTARYRMRVQIRFQHRNDTHLNGIGSLEPFRSPQRFGAGLSLCSGRLVWDLGLMCRSLVYLRNIFFFPIIYVTP